MFISKCDRVCWRAVRLVWPLDRSWRYRLQLVFVLFKALWLQDKFIFGEDGEAPESGVKRP